MKSIVVASLLFAAVPTLAMADQALLSKNACMACHAVDRKLVGPAYKDIAKRYQGDAQAVDKLTAKVKKGGAGVWGPIPMPPHAHVPDADIKNMVKWILAQ
jgi:cytochrome c